MSTDRGPHLAPHRAPYRRGLRLCLNPLLDAEKEREEDFLLPLAQATPEEKRRYGNSSSKFEERMQRLHEVSQIDLGFPHEFLAREGVRQFVHGGMFGHIDNHRRHQAL